MKSEVLYDVEASSIDPPDLGVRRTRLEIRPRFLTQSLALGFVLPALIIVGWEVGVRLTLVDGRLMPPPSRVLALALQLLKAGDLLHHIGATLVRVGLGGGIGVLIATVAGVASGVSRTIHALIDPLIQAIRAIPSIAWVPLFILWFGIFEQSKIILIALGAFFPVYLATTEAVRSADRKLIEVGRALRLQPLTLLRYILLPLVFPAWVVSLRTALGLAFMFVVAAEIMGASEGLGYLLVDGQQLGRPDEILVALVTFAVVGKVCDALLVAITRPMLHWRDVADRVF